MRSAGLLVLTLVLASCAPTLPDPVRVNTEGTLDLTSWNFAVSGPVLPMGWLWDSGVLWSGETGRPESLGLSAALGSPERGGTLPAALQAGAPLAAATARLLVRVKERRSYGFQIGAFPGAYQVWVNRVLVAESGVMSLDRERYRPGGAGNAVTLQPLDGQLDIVVAMVTTDPLVRHSELNRYWILGPASLLDVEQAERIGRYVQATFLFLGALLFLGIALLRPTRRTVLPFVGFLALCLLKILFNVEQAEPLLEPFFPGIPASVYLFLNHGLNLLPFPLFVHFLARQFPQDVSRLSVAVVVIATAVATLWELFPFVALALGAQDLYAAVMKAQWAFFLNLYVVLVVLFIFERIYHLFARKRPLSKALFIGGLAIGLIVLLPIPLSYFIPVKYTLFLGWGVFMFLIVLGSALVRLQVVETDEEVRRLTERLDRRESVARFLPPGWARRLDRLSAEELRPGDHRTAEAVFLQLHAPADALPLVGEAALQRNALLVSWSDGAGVWAMEDWPEAALAFALEVHRRVTAAGLPCRQVLTRAATEFRILDAGASWAATARVPSARLADLYGHSVHLGSAVLVDANLQEGLVIGGWKRHRRVSMTGREIELYEGEEESLASIKDATMDAFEAALAYAKEGNYTQAIQSMVAVIRKNPFDQAALALLGDWGAKPH